MSLEWDVSHGTARRGVRVRKPQKARDFSPLQNGQTDKGESPASYPIDIEVSFSKSQAARA
jgi:hypothetical protein